MMNANKAHLLKYANSGDITGDNSSVVGYAAAVYCR
jgi:AmmeMemoRadiSam system protein B